MKLRNKILTATLPLILLPLIAVIFANYYFVIRANRIQAEEKRVQTINNAVDSIRNEIDLSRKDLKLIANIPAVVDYLDAEYSNRNDAKELEKSVRDTLKFVFDRNPYYTELSLIDSDGNEKIKYNRQTDRPELKKVLEKKYFRKTLTSSNSTRQFSISEDGTVFSSNISNGKFVGMIAITLSARVFERSMKPLIDSDVSAFLVDDRGIVFADLFDSKNVAKPSNEKLSEISSGVIALGDLENKGRKVSLGNGGGLLSIVPAYYFPQVGFLQAQPGEKWFIGVLDSSNRSRTSTVYQILFFSVLFISVITLYFVASKVARRVTVPLESVVEASAQIARGDSFDLNVNTGDEIEDLALAFRKMNDELSKYQKQLVQSARLATMGEMTASISHEIQNRISGMSLWVQFLDSEIAEGDPNREYLNEMKLGLDGFMDLLANLKKYYRIPVLEISEVDLNSLVSDSMPFVQEKLDEKGISVVLDLEDQLPEISADMEKLRSVILNLLINGIDSMGNGGRLDVRTGLLSANNLSHVLLEVSDNGSGIGEEDLSQIFYPFYSTKSSGSGLGLAISANIITAHKGKIDVESEVGKGTVFRVLLPILKEGV